jgi:L,D-peptidoglycan transpeptidase YkuD (ErfK/YbiS/YcfS/YnhG family)
VTPDDLVVTPMGLRFQGRIWPCTVGRGGIVPGERKREGDGCTPAGVHGIVGCLYRPDRVVRAEVPGWAVPIRPRDLWCDDPESEDYNLMARAPFGTSHERLWRADAMYDVVLVTDWNWPEAKAGRGSAIFVHIWRRPGAATAGCVALARTSLMAILPGIRHRTRLVVAEGLVRKPA